MTIAIIGAGPAGAMAALCLARAGAPATVFDPSHPREKPCGGVESGYGTGPDMSSFSGVGAASAGRNRPATEAIAG